MSRERATDARWSSTGRHPVRTFATPAPGRQLHGGSRRCPATIERERRRYEKETPPPAARRDDVRVPFGNKHILLGGGAAARRAFHPRYRRRYLARHEKQNKARGTGLKPEERTEAQQQKCVTASATVGALLRYIRRCDEKNAKRNEKFGYGQTGPRTKQQQEACVAASATVGAFLQYISRRDDKNAKSNEKFGYGQTGPLTKQQQEACVSASATVALLRYICRRDEKNAKYGWGLPPDQLTDEQQQACVSASSTVDACS